MKRKIENLYGIDGVFLIGIKIIKKDSLPTVFETAIHFTDTHSCNSFNQCLPGYLLHKKDDCMITMKGNLNIKRGKKRYDFVLGIFDQIEKSLKGKKEITDHYNDGEHSQITTFDVEKKKDDNKKSIFRNAANGKSSTDASFDERCNAYLRMKKLARAEKDPKKAEAWIHEFRGGW